VRPLPQTLPLPAENSGLAPASPGDGPDKPVLKDDLLDLTPYLREAILLEFPTTIRCCDAVAPGVPKRADAVMTENGTAGRQSVGLAN